MTKRVRTGTKKTPLDLVSEVQSNPYKSERIDMEDGLVSIKYPIRLTKDRLELMDRICETLGEHPDIYIAQALYEKIDSDLHSPTELGMAFCDNLLKQWNTYKDERDGNDYRLLNIQWQLEHYGTVTSERDSRDVKFQKITLVPVEIEVKSELDALVKMDILENLGISYSEWVERCYKERMAQILTDPTEWGKLTLEDVKRGHCLQEDSLQD